jgi:hypothetical protein
MSGTAVARMRWSGGEPSTLAVVQGTVRTVYRACNVQNVHVLCGAWARWSLRAQFW